MRLHELIECAESVECLNLLSLEGGIYVLDIIVKGKRHSLRDDTGKVWHLRSVEHARDVLQELPEVPFFLVHSSAYDEMCGLTEGVRAPLRVPLSLRSQW